MTEINCHEPIGVQLASIRKRLGISQRQVAQKMGWDAGNLSRFERGIAYSSATLDTVASYGRALGLDKIELICSAPA